MFISLHILLIFLIGIISISDQKEFNCGNETKQFDLDTVDYILLAAPTRKFPTNSDQLKKFCKDNPVIASNLKAFVNSCFDKLSKRFASLMFYSIQKTNSNMCRSRRRSAELIQMAECGNAVNKDNRKCWDSWIKSSNGIGDVTQTRLRLPLLCCITYATKSCFERNYENNKKCTKNSSRGLETLFGGYLTNLLKLMCGDYTEDNDKCDLISSKLPSSKSKNNSLLVVIASIFQGVSEDSA